MTPVEQVQGVVDRLQMWVDDREASPTILGAITADLVRLCESWPAAGLADPMEGTQP